MDTTVDISIDRKPGIGYTPQSVFTMEDTLATHIIPLDLSTQDARDELEAMQYAYTNGSCIAFAAAMHQITGWNIVALDMDLTHVGVRAPDGTIWDARGPVTPEQFIESFADAVPEEFPIITWEYLRGACPAIDFLPAAQRHASMMFPQLPHLPTSDRSRNLAFMNEVEALCRRQNYWIVAQQRESMTTWPVIGEAFDEEVGYRAANNHGTRTMDRMLRSEQGRGPNHLPHGLDLFLRELADLSRKHGLWIRAGLPTTWPRVVRLDHNEVKTAHYVMRQTDNAAGFLTTLR